MAFGDLTTGQKRFAVTNPGVCNDNFLELVAKFNKAQHGEAIIKLKQPVAPGTYSKDDEGHFDGNF